MNTADRRQAVSVSGAPGRSSGLSPGQDLADWWDSMVWHRVLRSAVLGLRPGRLGLAFFFVAAVLLLLMIGRGIDAQIVAEPALVMHHETPPAIPGDNDPFFIWRLFIMTPLTWLGGWPVTTLVVGPLALVLGVILLGAIVRIAAEEFARGRFVPWTEGLAFSARLWKSTLGAVVGPVVLVWVLTLLVVVLGGLLMNWPGLNVIGGLLYGLNLTAATVAVVVAIVFLLGGAMLIPAVICDGADAIDAVQRAYAYVLARPVRLVVYLGLALLGVVVITAILWTIVAWSIGFALSSSGALARPDSWKMLWWATFGVTPIEDADGNAPQGSYSVAAAFIRIWVLVPALLVVAGVASMLTSAATIIYLAMRRVCDGQDLGELWTPGAVEASMAQVMASRARAAGIQGASEGAEAKAEERQ